MPPTDIRELTTESEGQAAFPILVQLRDHLDRESYADLLEEMRAEGYRLFARYVDDDPVAVAGVKIATNFYLGRHAYVYDLVTDEAERSTGHGERLLEFVHEWAAENGCEAVELESGLWREDAHRFYTERMGYEKYCYSFVYDLS
ncbi:GNAT family N-acetyltransferase [Natrinema salaciae]|uniref:Acetyltransferase (GNAT) family protein n=1 Tax=Natrinema salaciae TaxID=1186196 RepID=A0A1H9NSA6_9EURY|nr:GNAT family N-acetyltransferase [Natrinema salaciae]SER38792.1 Acetyltransferase (GNAT) family protein [Natrinema salaciae]